jgi:hypothetical protein
MRFFQPKRLAVLGALVLAAGILAACVPPPPPPPPPPTMVDDDGLAAPGDCNATTTAASTIGAAVTAAASGTHIDVCPGTYAEQLTIPNTKNDITRQSTQSRAATIKAPASMAEPGDIIRVNGATGLIITGFVISGPLPNALFCSTETRAGLFVAGRWLGHGRRQQVPGDPGHRPRPPRLPERHHDPRRSPGHTDLRDGDDHQQRVRDVPEGRDRDRRDGIDRRHQPQPGDR